MDSTQMRAVGEGTSAVAERLESDRKQRRRAKPTNENIETKSFNGRIIFPAPRLCGGAEDYIGARAARICIWAHGGAILFMAWNVLLWK